MAERTLYVAGWPATRLERLVAAFVADERPAFLTIDYLERGVAAIVEEREGLLDVLADAGWLATRDVLAEGHATYAAERA